MTRRTFLPAAAAAMTGRAHAQGRKPNVVLILTDNHGAWTLGCYGNKDIRTPHIDRMASEGVLFTRAHANNAVCSPTRASLLTGLMPSQHGVHTYFGAGDPQIGPNAYNAIKEFATIPKMLASKGYVAGLSGKWHLGDNLNPQEGFSYWVTKPHGSSEGFYDQEVVENHRVRREPKYLTEFWTDHAVKFIEANREKPFFLMLAYNGPYGLGGAMKEPVRNAHAAYYSQHELPSMPRDNPHPWNHHYASWMNDAQVRRKYAAEVSGIDDGVGRVFDTLKRNGLDDDTFVIFIGDQGLAGGHSGFWGMGDHTRPLTAFDWTTWIPFVARHPKGIPGGRRLDSLVSTYDVFPSLASYLGLESELPSPPRLPGRDFSPALKGRTMSWDDTVFFEFENVRSIRAAEWKYIERIHESPNELYHLKSDPGERLNLYGRPEHRQTQESLRARLHEFFARYADPKWDLWKGGKSKANLITADLFGIRNPYGRRR